MSQNAASFDAAKRDKGALGRVTCDQRKSGFAEKRRFVNGARMPHRPIGVALDWSEVSLAAHAGVDRRIFALQHNCRETFETAPEIDEWGIDVNGCLGELAVAKHLGVYWSGTVGRIDLPDVGRLQVRASKHSGAHLLIYPRDNDDDVFLLVTGSVPRFQIRGFLQGVLGKRKQFWRSDVRKPGWWIPQNALNDPSLLRA